MELKNFGSILNFAAELEAGDEAFYRRAAENPSCSSYKEVLQDLVKDHKQNEQRILRVRRENVTEMILEPIKDFTRAPFLLDYPAAERMEQNTVLQTAQKLEARAEDYYREAAEKIKALPEVTGELRRIGKRHALHREKLSLLK